MIALSDKRSASFYECPFPLSGAPAAAVTIVVKLYVTLLYYSFIATGISRVTIILFSFKVIPLADRKISENSFIKMQS